MHLFGCSVFLLLATSVGAQPQTRPAEPPSFRSASSELVVLPVTGDNASRATLNEVLTRARGSNAAIDTIGLFDNDDPDRNAGVLKSLARATGGERFLPEAPGSLLESCKRLAREIRGGYTIGYVPPDRDGSYHQVRVQIEPADPRRLTLRTRPGYFAAGSPTRP